MTPEPITVDPSGNVIVGDNSYRMQKFDASGAFSSDINLCRVQKLNPQGGEQAPSL